jgi:NADPH:quinone reductase-like Zn-dependent oxidoreductase
MASKNTKYLAWAKGHLLPATTAKPSMIEPTEVMIPLKAVAINPADTKMIDQGI